MAINRCATAAHPLVKETKYIALNITKQCDQTWPFPANLAVFGVWVAGKIWLWLVAGVAGYYIYVVKSCPGLGIFLVIFN